MKTLWQSFSAAGNGVRHAMSGQRNIRLHVGAAFLVVTLGVYVELTPADWVVIAFAIGFVLTAEMMNTAVETVVDLVEPRQNPLAGKAKDIAAGAVLVAAVTSVVVGVLVFYKYFV